MARQVLVILFPVLLASWLCGAEPAQAVTCDPLDPTNLCLAPGNRFRVQVTRINPKGKHFAGKALPLIDNAESGAFWFFLPGSPDVVVKILKGNNGFFWVFYAGLTEAQFDITVTDTNTGQENTYHSPPGQLASFADVTAFQDGAQAVQPGTASAEAGSSCSSLVVFTYSVAGDTADFTTTTAVNATYSCWEFDVLPTCFPGEQCTLPFPPCSSCDGGCTLNTAKTGHKYMTSGSHTVRFTQYPDPRVSGSPMSYCQTLVIPGCQYQVFPDAVSFGSDGGTGHVKVIASNSCSWSAESHDGFITITDPGPGKGNGTVSFLVAQNLTTDSLEGDLLVAGTKIDVTQEGIVHGACVPNASTLCLVDNRFEVRMDSALFGSVRAFRFSGDTGYFHYQDSANVELMTTAVDLKNGHFLLYFGDMTTVPSSVTVRDTMNNGPPHRHRGDGELVSWKDIF